MNFRIELLKTISTLVKYCLSIYEQIQTIDQIKKQAKFSITVQTIVNVLSRAVISSFRASAISNNNTSFLRLSNTFQGSITTMSKNLDAGIS